MEKKVINMNSQKEENNTQVENKELSNDQLKTLCTELYKQIQKIDLTNNFRVLDYLFLVMENKSNFSDKVFVDKCEEEIKNAISGFCFKESKAQ